MGFTLEGKVAIVTGGGGGIGATTSELLASLGASVVVADINLPGAESVVEGIRNAGGKAVAQKTDLESEKDIVELIQRAVDEFGGIDILDNNAALTEVSHFSRDMEVVNMDADVWDRTFAVNVRGSMLTCKHSIPHMQRRGGGAIINISSASGLAGDAITSAYGSSKAALVGLTMYVAAQHLKDGIRCNGVAPGLVMTPTARDVAPADVIETFDRQMSRVGDPIDIARVVAFLGSDYGSFITGQVISADGGLLKHMPNLVERQKSVAEARAAAAEPE